MAYIVQNTIKTKAKTFKAGEELSADDVKKLKSDLENLIKDGAVLEVGKKSSNEDDDKDDDKEANK